MKWLFELTKAGIITFVVICAAAGYALGFRIESEFSILHLLSVLVGITLLSGGSFALNQIQEVELDKKMPRTRRRPLACGRISERRAWSVALTGLVLGSILLFRASWTSGALGLLTVFLYNVCYTLYWKRRLAFGAVPGAIPGAMPVVIGYAANTSNIFTSECAYAFLIMFLWQMPHYWSLAIRFAKDYREAGIPVLPVSRGERVTAVQIGLYTFVYVGLALLSPWFVDSRYLYLFVVIPLALKVMWEFFKYMHGIQQNWLRFFMWTNVSMLVFLIAAVVDKWHTVVSNIYF
jgi:protoheme IX farnesyltransferase